jgi:hypothetical protein
MRRIFKMCIWQQTKGGRKIRVKRSRGGSQRVRRKLRRKKGGIRLIGKGIMRELRRINSMILRQHFLLNLLLVIKNQIIHNNNNNNNNKIKLIINQTV